LFRQLARRSEPIEIKTGDFSTFARSFIKKLLRGFGQGARSDEGQGKQVVSENDQNRKSNVIAQS
jgi:hypothetical protein